MMAGMNIDHAPPPTYPRPPRPGNNKYFIIWWHPILLSMNKIVKARTQNDAIKKYKKYIKDTYDINCDEIEYYNLSKVEILK